MSIQERIRNRREALGATATNLADWSGIPVDRVRAIEAGQPLSSTELGRLTRSLAVDLGSFLRGEEQRPGRSTVRFRKALSSDEPAPLELKNLALAAELGRIAGRLVDSLGLSLPVIELRDPKPVKDGEEPWKQGYELGSLARRKTSVSSEPITDLQGHLEGLGVHVALAPFARADIDAASVMEPGAVPVLLLNQNSPRISLTLPRRAAMAHELCHILHDVGEHDLETYISSTDDSQSEPWEQRARAFAPAFLAPPREVRARQDDLEEFAGPEADEQRVLDLAKHWGLSWAGAVWHAKNCDLITTPVANELTQLPQKTDWQSEFESPGRASPGSMENPRPAETAQKGAFEVGPYARGNIARWTLQALDAGILSAGRAREILSWG